MINYSKIRRDSKLKLKAFTAKLKGLYVSRNITAGANKKTFYTCMNTTPLTFDNRLLKHNWKLQDFFAVEEYLKQLENTPEHNFMIAHTKVMEAIRELNIITGIEVLNVPEIDNQIITKKEFCRLKSGDAWQKIKK